MYVLLLVLYHYFIAIESIPICSTFYVIYPCYELCCFFIILIYYFPFYLCYTRLSFFSSLILFPIDFSANLLFPFFFFLPVLLSPPSPPGFLQITPEGSPQAQRKGEVGGETDILGSFCLHTSGLDFDTLEKSEEHQVSSTEVGTVTAVTKTTRITQRMVTTETRTGESSTTTTKTQQVSDNNY